MLIELINYLIKCKLSYEYSNSVIFSERERDRVTVILEENPLFTGRNISKNLWMSERRKLYDTSGKVGKKL